LYSSSCIFPRCLIFSLSTTSIRIAKGEDLLLSFRSFQDCVFHSSRRPPPSPFLLPSSHTFPVFKTLNSCIAADFIYFSLKAISMERERDIINSRYIADRSLYYI
jgi:hypothetical protein